MNLLLCSRLAPSRTQKIDLTSCAESALQRRGGLKFTRSSAPIGSANNYRRKSFCILDSLTVLSADHATPCRQAIGRMLLHPVSELRRAHQAGLH
jgi:hypothetical protein